MKWFLRIVYVVVRLFSPDKEKSVKSSYFDAAKYKWYELKHNDPCYCESGKKYKRCHLSKNKRAGAVAINIHDKSTGDFVKTTVIAKDMFRQLKGRTTPPDKSYQNPQDHEVYLT